MKKVRGNRNQFHCTVKLPVTQMLLSVKSVRYPQILICGHLTVMSWVQQTHCVSSLLLTCQFVVGTCSSLTLL